MEKLKEKIDEELHSPAVSFKTVQERAKRVEEAMEKRRKRFMQEKYGYEKEGIIEDFNDNLEAYPQWITKVWFSFFWVFNYKKKNLWAFLPPFSLISLPRTKKCGTWKVMVI